MNEFTFDTISQGWTKFIRDHAEDIKTRTSDLTRPEEIYMKKIQETPEYLVVQFMGLSNAVGNSQFIPQVKREIERWVKGFSMSVQIMPSTANTFTLRVSKELKFSESWDKEVKINQTKIPTDKYESKNPESLTTIIRTKARS